MQFIGKVIELRSGCDSKDKKRRVKVRIEKCGAMYDALEFAAENGEFALDQACIVTIVPVNLTDNAGAVA